MSGIVLQFPKRDDNDSGFFSRDTPARTHRRRHLLPEEGRRRLLAGTLPPYAVILGGLSFSDRDKPMFPPNVRICGSLDMYNCLGVTKLGDGLHVDKDADFTGTPLARLPRKLRVGGTMDITGTNIKGVPRDMVVQKGVIVDEFASPSLKALALKRPAKWMPPVLSF